MQLLSLVEKSAFLNLRIKLYWWDDPTLEFEERVTSGTYLQVKTKMYSQV